MENRQKLVFLWFHVYSISTAFERSFMQRNDYITFHEPLNEPCYFGSEHLYNYFDANTNTTYFEVVEQILNTAKNNQQKKIFAKDMVRHILRPDYKSHPENVTVLPIDFFKPTYISYLSIREIYSIFI